MSKVCPSCGSTNLSTKNPFGRWLCDKCGWMGENETPIVGFGEWVKAIYRWTFIVLLVVSSLTIFFQFFSWKQYSFEASYLQIKSFLKGYNEKAHFQLGAICNTLEDLECSIEHFYKVVERNPNHKDALGNLAINLAQSNRWLQARPNFEAYFSLGGEAVDALYWYGKTLLTLESPDKGIPWYFYALKYNPNYDMAAMDLLNHYIGNNNFISALSLVGAINGGKSSNKKLWRDFTNSESIHKQFEQAEEDMFWRLPSLDGVNFYLPVKLKLNGPIDFFRVDDRSSKNLVSQETLDKLLIDWDQESKDQEIRYKGELIKAKSLEIENVNLGGWKKEKLKVFICTKCEDTLGKEFLRDFEVERWTEHKTDFLELRPNNSN